MIWLVISILLIIAGMIMMGGASIHYGSTRIFNLGLIAWVIGLVGIFITAFL